MDTSVEKDNASKRMLAEEVVKGIFADSDMEVMICHQLFIRHPDAVSETMFLGAAQAAGLTEQFEAAIHELCHSGIVRKGFMGNRNLYSLTSEFFDIMTEAKNDHRAVIKSQLENIVKVLTQ